MIPCVVSTCPAPHFRRTMLRAMRPMGVHMLLPNTDPGETVKARLQVQGELGSYQPYRSTLDAIIQIARKEGLRGFYRGFPAVAIGNVPANMAYFGGYEIGRSLVPPDSGMAGDMAVGAVAQLTGGLLFTPIDIVKERMQVQGIMSSQRMYRGSWHVLRSLVADGGILGLFRGYWATNAVWIPWSVLYISLYEHSKRTAARWLAGKDINQPQSAASMSTMPDSQTDEPVVTAPALPVAKGSSHSASTTGPPASSSVFEASSEEPAASREGANEATTSGTEHLLPPWALGVCSAGSASIAAIATHPMDVVKTRLQVMSAGAGKLTALGIARAALQREGPKVFMTGALARIMTLAPGSALSWMIYEPVKQALEQRLA